MRHVLGTIKEAVKISSVHGECETPAPQPPMAKEQEGSMVKTNVSKQKVHRLPRLESVEADEAHPDVSRCQLRLSPPRNAAQPVGEKKFRRRR